MSNQTGNPRVVICGSSSAIEAMRTTGAFLRSQQIDVVLPSNAQQNVLSSGNGLAKLESIFEYYHEIGKCDAVLIVNEPKGNLQNYIGPHTLIEMAFTRAQKKKLYLLRSMPENLPWLDEIKATSPEPLEGDLDRFVQEVKKSHFTASQMSEEVAANFKLERLKFLLQQIDRENRQHSKHLQFYQAVVTAIIGAAAGLVGSWKSLKLDPALAKSAVEMLIWLLMANAVFTSWSIFTGMHAWFDYRNEEVECFRDALGYDYRRKPTWRNFAYWHESWLLLFVLGTAAVLSLAGYCCVLPLFK